MMVSSPPLSFTVKYCTTCGKPLLPKDIIYPDLQQWAKDYEVAKTKGDAFPPIPPTRTTCCGISSALYPSNLEWEWQMPTLGLGMERIEHDDITVMIKICNHIGKNPFRIKTCGDIYFIDIKARHFKNRLRNLIDGLLLDKGNNNGK